MTGETARPGTIQRPFADVWPRSQQRERLQRLWRAHSELRWLDERGAEVRCESFPCTITGLVMDVVLAFDDAGVLYALLTARIGDGVSGCDQADGATAAFDASGCLWTHPVRTKDGLQGCTPLPAARCWSVTACSGWTAPARPVGG